MADSREGVRQVAQGKHKGIRRGHGEGSIYQRDSDGRWLAVIELGWIDGKRKRRTITAKTRAEVVRKLRALHAELDQGILTDNATVQQWLEYWMSDIAKIRDSTREGYRSKLDTWIIPALGKIRLAGLTADHIRALHKKMRDAGKSETTVRQAHAILQAALEVAAREGRIVRNPARIVRSPTADKNPHEVLWVDEVLKVLTANPEPRDRARLTVALLLGLRQGEALGLTWDRVKLWDNDGVVAGEITISSSVQRRRKVGLVVDDVKSSHSDRHLPLPAPVALSLWQWQQQCPTSGWVFPGHNPVNPEDPRRDYQAWLDALARADVRRVPLHGARGSTASVLMALNIPVPVIADILGQATIRVTEKHYLHTSPQQVAEAMAALGTRLAIG